MRGLELGEGLGRWVRGTVRYIFRCWYLLKKCDTGAVACRKIVLEACKIIVNKLIFGLRYKFQKMSSKILFVCFVERTSFILTRPSACDYGICEH